MHLEQIQLEGSEYPWLDGCYRRVLMNTSRKIQELLDTQVEQKLKLLAAKRVSLQRQRLPAADQDTLLEHYHSTVVEPKLPLAALSDDASVTLGTELEHLWRNKLEKMQRIHSEHVIKMDAMQRKTTTPDSSVSKTAKSFKDELKSELAEDGAAHLPRFFRGSTAARLGTIDGYFVPRPDKLQSTVVKMRELIEDSAWDELSYGRSAQAAHMRREVLQSHRRRKRERDDGGDGMVKPERRSSSQEPSEEDSDGNDDKDRTSVIGTSAQRQSSGGMLGEADSSSSICTDTFISDFCASSSPRPNLNLAALSHGGGRPADPTAVSAKSAVTNTTITSTEVGGTRLLVSPTAWISTLPSNAAVSVVRKCLERSPSYVRDSFEPLLVLSSRTIDERRKLSEQQQHSSAAFNAGRILPASGKKSSVAEDSTSRNEQQSQQIARLELGAAGYVQGEFGQLVVNIPPYDNATEQELLSPFLWPSDVELAKYSHNELTFSVKSVKRRNDRGGAKKRGETRYASVGGVAHVQRFGSSGLLRITGRGEFAAATVVIVGPQQPCTSH